MPLARIPASSANLGPGFDCLGVALNLYNYVEIEASDQPLQIKLEGIYRENLPTDTSNLVYCAVQRFWRHIGKKPSGITLRLVNNIPPSRGLGSSSAAIVGGLYAANLLANSPLNKAELLDLATEMEGHPDNVAAAIYGGANLSVLQPSGHCICQSLGYMDELKLVVAIPDMTLATSLARNLLPPQVVMRDAVWNIGRTGLLVASLLSGNYSLLQTAMEDRLHEQYRAPAIPGMTNALKQAKQAGALAAVLSGAGPTLLAIVPANKDENDIGQAMAEAFTHANIKADIHTLTADRDGAVAVVVDDLDQLAPVTFGGLTC
ncbi:MAG: homoserine kinase [Peptococcaceae bacterium]|nr:homoserine kinase [Peptococcaceae bacterium]